ncbi:MAG: hypothetical protein WC783_00930 [Candidatus Paceibacterota bacterium]|jgi:hypothetical protein
MKKREDSVERSDLDKFVQASELDDLDADFEDEDLGVFSFRKEYASLYDKFKNASGGHQVSGIFDSVTVELAQEADELEKLKASVRKPGLRLQISFKRAAILKMLSSNETFRKRVIAENVEVSDENIEKVLNIFLSSLMEVMKDSGLGDKLNSILPALKEKTKDIKSLISNVEDRSR